MVEKYFSGTGNSKYAVELSMIQRMCQLLNRREEKHGKHECIRRKNYDRKRVL